MSINKDSKKAPNLRFKGFTDDWEQRELSHLVEINSGRDYKHLNTGNIPVYGTGGLMLFVDKALSYDEDGIGIGRKGTIDKPYILKAPFWTVDTLFYCIPKGQTNIYFGYAIFQKINWKFKDESTGVPSLSKKTISTVKIYSTKYEEQEKIGHLFTKLDDIITLQQRKLDQLIQLKEALLQQMFPGKGETVPKLRFAGFEGEWEDRKLGDLGEVSMNKRIYKDQTTLEGEIPFVKIGTFGKKPDSFISRELFEEYKLKYPYPNIGDILISASGSIGRTLEYKGEDVYFQDSNIVWLNHKGRLDNNFLKYFYTIVTWSGLEGSTIKRLYNKNILSTQIKLPNLIEQEKIGNFLNCIENTIILQQRKLDQLKNMKQVLLENMFI